MFRVVSRLFVVPADQPIQASQPHSFLLEWPALTLALVSLLMGLAAPYPLYILEAGETAVTLLSMGVMP
jgi:hypothetical protein